MTTESKVCIFQHCLQLDVAIRPSSDQCWNIKHDSFSLLLLSVLDVVMMAGISATILDQEMPCNIFEQTWVSDDCETA